MSFLRKNVSKALSTFTHPIPQSCIDASVQLNEHFRLWHLTGGFLFKLLKRLGPKAGPTCSRIRVAENITRLLQTSDLISPSTVRPSQKHLVR